MSFAFYSWIKGYGGEIRGQQMATALGGTFNDGQDHPEARCVYLIGTHPDLEPPCAYYDVMDGPIPRLRKIRDTKRGALISVSKEHDRFLAEVAPTRDRYYLPQHHCNFERVRRPEREIRVVGCIGGYSAIQWPHHAIADYFTKNGMEWRFQDNVRHRHQVVEFYQTIDVQLVWRPMHMRDPRLQRCLSPLKLANAGSFGIPTVAFPEPGYTSEWSNECLWGASLIEALSKVLRLREHPGWHQEIAERARQKAEEYHIDRIAALYRQLPMPA